MEIRILLLAALVSCSLALEVPCPKSCICTKAHLTGNHAECKLFDPSLQLFSHDLNNLVIKDYHRPEGLTLSDKIFYDLKLLDLESITITNSSLHNVHPDTFFGLTKLKHVDLSFNQLKHLDPDVFKHNGELKTVSLNDNPIMLNSTDNFLRSDSIRELLLSNCWIINVHDNAFQELRNLEYIDLSGNDLSEITAGMFAKLVSLEEVNLADNRIWKISKDAFIDVEDMTTLILSGNSIKTMEGVDISGLKQLDLSECEFEILMADTFEGFRELTNLNLSGNSIQDINPEAFTDLHYLRYLDLSNNNIRAPLNKYLFEFNKQLETLSLAGNKELRVFSGFNNEAPNLYKLDLSHCGLVEISRLAFKKMPYINSLNISHNDLSHVDPKLFANLVDLKTLDLSHNSLRGLNSKVFFSNPKLEKLYLSHNHFVHLPAIIFVHTPRLDALDISYNSITNLWNLTESFVMKNENILGQLTYLNVAGNKLKALHMHTFISLSSLDTLVIDNNPIECKPDFSHIMQWLMEKQVLPDRSTPRLPSNLGLISNNARWNSVLKVICPVDLSHYVTRRPTFKPAEPETWENGNREKIITEEPYDDQSYELIQPMDEPESTLVWPMVFIWVSLLTIVIAIFNLAAIIICKARRGSQNRNLSGQFVVRRGGRTHYQKLYEDCSIPAPVHASKTSKINVIFGLPQVRTNSSV